MAGIATAKAINGLAYGNLKLSSQAIFECEATSRKARFWTNSGPDTFWSPKGDSRP